MVIAYEPIWAIGTGKTATPDIAAQAHLIIRSEVARMAGRPLADALRILYGGSVKPENAQALSQPEIDGALIGGAILIRSTPLLRPARRTRYSQKLLSLQQLPDKLQLFPERRRLLR
jgi:triosephosphate isomerase